MDLQDDSVAERFWEQIEAAGDTMGEEASLQPSRIAWAARSTLVVAGVGIGLARNEHQIALGASDPTAALAERLQFMLNDGPGWEASRRGLAVSAHCPDIIRTRWSLFADQLLTRTPYRAVLSAPVSGRDGQRFAVDLFMTDPSAAMSMPFSTVTTVVDQVAAALGTTADLEHSLLPGEAARFDVWIAVGMAMSQTGLEHDDALALLRARCVSDDCSLDELASRVVSGDAAILV